MSIRPRPPFTPKSVRKFFDYVDRQFFNAEEGAWTSDRNYGTCTWFNQSPALLLENRGYVCQIFGVDDKTMEDTRLRKRGCVGGHDWLLIDGRWIFDAWAAIYCGTRPLIDLHDINGKEYALRFLYPRQTQWRLVPFTPGARVFGCADWLKSNAIASRWLAG